MVHKRREALNKAQRDRSRRKRESPIDTEA